MIDVQNLTKYYRNHPAIDRVTFKAKSGEVIGLLGPNGAGKTTTMRILTGFMPPTSGSATIAEFDLAEDSLEIRRRVGYMPERVPIYPDMTVEGYITFWAKLRGLRRPAERVREVIHQVGLDDRRRSLLRSLSKGMRQRLGLAQALVHQPQVIILDEPTIGIDPYQVIEVRQWVRELGRDHTVLFSTHILTEAEQVCDRVVILNQGRVVAQGKPDALRQQLYPGDHVYVHIEGGQPAQIQKALERIPGVESVTPAGSGFNLRARRGAEIRPKIVEQFRTGHQLIELRPVAMTLEDIFLDIVSREGGQPTP